MFIRTSIQPNRYYDSLLLMRVSQDLLKQPGVVHATLAMGTEANKSAIAHVYSDVDFGAAGPNDLILFVGAETEAQARAAEEFGFNAIITERMRSAITSGSTVHSLSSALHRQPLSNLALLSIPGKYVKREARKALDAGLNLFIFSDNVPLEDEIELKQIAHQRGLLVMGPDCGTAIVGGAALAFANAVRRGQIGLVGASGTGLQEVSCLIDRLGEGVSHALGTGSHDIDARVGGITMMDAIQRLDSDGRTEVIVVISKPPAPQVLEHVMSVIRTCHKPVVVNFLDAVPSSFEGNNAIVAPTLEEAAIKAVAVASARTEIAIRQTLLNETDAQAQTACALRAPLSSQQKFIRGIFSGGTFAAEAALFLRDALDPVYANTNVRHVQALPDPYHSVAHSCVDMGDDVFTLGKPHPMLQPSMRHERILAEAADPETAVILFDVVLGYGVHPNPALELAEYITEAKAIARQDGRELAVVASVCGVDADPQNRGAQVETLRAAGVKVMPSNAQAAQLAIQIVGPVQA